MTQNQNLCLAAVQMASGSDVDKNLTTAARLIGEAVRQGAKMVLLPEFFSAFTVENRIRLKAREKFGEGKTQDFLSRTAKAHKIWLFAGTIPLISPDENRVYNSLLVYNDTGECVARYDKMHLFSYQNGSEHYNEAHTIMPGDSLLSVETPFGRVGLAICYDLRFPELFRALNEENPLDLIVLPAAFTQTTGKAHWEILLRARAIENQCYVLASAQGGLHEGERQTFGHSIFIDPWGEILDCKHQGEGVVLGILEHDRLSAVRRTLPALFQRRLGNIRLKG